MRARSANGDCGEPGDRGDPGEPGELGPLLWIKRAKCGGDDTGDRDSGECGGDVPKKTGGSASGCASELTTSSLESRCWSSCRLCGSGDDDGLDAGERAMGERGERGGEEGRPGGDADDARGGGDGGEDVDGEDVVCLRGAEGGDEGDEEWACVCECPLLWLMFGLVGVGGDVLGVAGGDEVDETYWLRVWRTKTSVSERENHSRKRSLMAVLAVMV